jgi:hypothetical protein
MRKSSVLQRVALRKPREPEHVSLNGANATQEQTPSEEDIRIRAFQKWEEAGCPSCDGVYFWLAAEAELRGVK